MRRLRRKLCVLMKMTFTMMRVRRMILGLLQEGLVRGALTRLLYGVIYPRTILLTSHLMYSIRTSLLARLYGSFTRHLTRGLVPHRPPHLKHLLHRSHNIPHLSYLPLYYRKLAILVLTRPLMSILTIRTRTRTRAPITIL